MKAMSSRDPSPEEGLETKEMDIRSLSSSRRQPQNTSYIHKVGVPPKQNLFKELKDTVKETFFADDPLRPFKDQPKSKKFILGTQAVFPILEWGRHYNLKKLRGDIIAGLTIASLCIPQDIGYSKLANLDPQYGSRDIAIGPVAVVSLLLGTLLQNEIDPQKNKAEYQRLAFTATFFAGITQFTLGFLRLGFLIDFLSHAAIVGFMGGAAITISLQQLKGFLGIKKFTKKTDIVSVMNSVVHSAHHGVGYFLITFQFICYLLILSSMILAASSIGKKILTPIFDT
ncbi:Sulfate transporter 1.3 [Turnera subulata]|uniref:Sulfate transporter 1.3 n=1 Tax=Turnera subulata TaxID=218843 RepID=A0A9Q0EZW8_9ROSI|nr:Sulfate transporter 1.3 [Turnera subulata]